MRDVDEGHAWLCLIGAIGAQFLNGAMTYGSGIIHVGLLDYFKEDVAKTALIGSLFANILCLLGTNIVYFKNCIPTRFNVLYAQR